MEYGNYFNRAITKNKHYGTLSLSFRESMHMLLCNESEQLQDRYPTYIASAIILYFQIRTLFEKARYIGMSKASYILRK